MSNPFAQDGWDPFGELAAPQAAASAANSLRPARAPPAPPKPAVTANPFGQLAPTHPSTNSGTAAQDPFDLLTVSSNVDAPTVPPPSYESAIAGSVLPPPPAYTAADDFPPPPSYDAATAQAAAPPSYEQVVAPVTGEQQHQPMVRVPARPAPPSPAVQGPLHAGMTSRPAPARPAPTAPGSGGTAVPARPPPAAPMPPARAPPPAPTAARSASSTEADWDWVSSPICDMPAGNKAAQQLQQQLAAVHVSAGSTASSRASSSISSSYASTGSIGALPKAGCLNSQQALQQELSAQIRLPPLNPKNAAALKTLTAGLGSLFAGPAGDSSQLLQWSPNDSGTTLPAGARPCATEDHDSGACAELTPRAHDYSVSSSKPNRVTCMLTGHGPGLLWCGTLDGTVHCWSLAKDGTGTAAKWLHSWVAHSGKKVKALAQSPNGRLFTGGGNGAVKMWNYGSPAFADTAAPRPLRQLCKIDPRTGVSLDPHSKIIGLAVSTSGRVLWSVGKNTISLWSTHNGEHLGTMADDDVLLQQQQYGGYAGAGGPGSTAIDPRHGLDASRLDTLFERPLPELLAADDEALDGGKDAAAIAINAGVKAMGKASKLLNKFTNKLAAKILDEGRPGSSDLDGGHALGAGPGNPAAAGTAAKITKWGSIKKVAAAADGSIWIGYKRGLLEKYSEGGQLLWSSDSSAAATGPAGVFKPSGVTALAAVGSSVWLGDSQGQIWVLNAATACLQRTWKAHVFPVRSIAAGGHLVYSLGKAGSVRAWPAKQVPAALVNLWHQDLNECLQERQLQVLVGTWNVNETKPSRAGLQMWLADRARTADLVLIGLQEVEMGTSSVALDVVYQNLAKGRLEAGTQAAQAWAAAVGDVLRSVGDFKRVGLRQMSGVLVMVFAKAALEPHMGEVATASVACGVMGYGGNKGAVAVSFSLFRRRVVMVSSHFAAHQDKVESRNADYTKIVRHLHFHNVPTDKPQQQQQFESSDVVVMASGDSTSAPNSGRAGFGSPALSPKKVPRGAAAGEAVMQPASGVLEEDWGAGMRDAELLVWVGDFNYRIDQPDGFVPDMSDPDKWPISDQLYHFVHQKIAARQYLALLSGDQCIREMGRGAVFHTLAEGPINFMPTYKFEKGRESNAMQPFYDQGEKKRVPAWTDRVFFRGSGPQRSALQPNAAEQKSDVRVALASPQSYNSLMEVNDSDHKPVYALLNLQLPWYQQQQQRACSLGRLWEAAAAAGSSNGPSANSSYADVAAGGAVSLLVEPQQMTLQSSYIASSLRIKNPCRDSSCMFVIQGSGPGGGLPTWLEVVPASGVIEGGCTVRVTVQGTKAQWLSGGTRCELCVLGCLEGTVDSSRWPLSCYGYAQTVPVVLP